MNEEIKEMLDRLDFNEWEVDLYKAPITWSELYDIRDYITNLQKENENYKQRNEKAIEFIKEWWYGKNTLDINRTVSLGDKRIDLLNILQGGDE